MFNSINDRGFVVIQGCYIIHELCGFCPEDVKCRISTLRVEFTSAVITHVHTRRFFRQGRRIVQNWAPLSSGSYVINIDGSVFQGYKETWGTGSHS